jgi:hypothetical protein
MKPYEMALAADAANDAQTIGELNDVAVRTLRGMVGKGEIPNCTANNLRALVGQDDALMVRKGVTCWADYRRVSRAGLLYPLTREQRAVLYTATVTFRKARTAESTQG